MGENKKKVNGGLFITDCTGRCLPDAEKHINQHNPPSNIEPASTDYHLPYGSVFPLGTMAAGVNIFEVTWGLSPDKILAASQFHWACAGNGWRF